MQHKIKGKEDQASGAKSGEIQTRLVEFLTPLLVQLDAVLDKRLVRYPESSASARRHQTPEQSTAE